MRGHAQQVFNTADVTFNTADVMETHPARHPEACTAGELSEWSEDLTARPEAGAQSLGSTDRDSPRTPKAPKSLSSSYTILEVIGEGRSCYVVKCRDRRTNKKVAMKMFKESCSQQEIKREVDMLEEIHVRIPDSRYTVQFLQQCEHSGRSCLVFERLSMTLQDSIRRDGMRRLSLPCIRAVAQQLLLALDELKAANILHTDVHPGNIMYVEGDSIRLKLIGFGSTIKAPEAQPGMKHQPVAYRAPEVLLGLPITEAVDVWSVGCVLAYLYLGHDLFSVSSEDQMVKRVVELVGQPEDHLLCAGKYAQEFFTEDEAAADGPKWRLRQNTTDQLSSLEDLVKVRRPKNHFEYDDQRAFVDLLKQMLHVDGSQRISARRALHHPFTTMKHLKDHFDHHNYNMRCIDFMTSYHLEMRDIHHSRSYGVLTPHWDEEGRIVLHSSSASYTVLKRIGTGTCCYIVKCRNRTTGEYVAVKIPDMDADEKLTVGEVSTFEEINARIPDNKYIVKCIDRCEYNGKTCLVFECLDVNLISKCSKPLPLIRPIAKQLFLALGELKAANILHGDLHSGNIMFVNKQDQPHRVKLIDFNSSIKATEVQHGRNLRTCYPYRSPEHFLGLPITEAIDVWAVGCVLDQFYQRYQRFNETSDQRMVRRFIEVLGQPEDHLLHAGKYTQEFFTEDEAAADPRRRLKLRQVNNDKYDPEGPVNNNVEDTYGLHREGDTAEGEDKRVFVDLLRQLLQFDWSQRISAHQALQHPFITMEHLLTRPDYRSYLDASLVIMNECPVFSTDNPADVTLGPVPEDADPWKPADVPLGPVPEDADPWKPADVPLDVSASSGHFRKLLGKIRRFFHRVETSDREITPVAASCCCDGGRSPVSASSGHPKKMLKRICRAFRRVKKDLCCCCQCGALIISSVD